MSTINDNFEFSKDWTDAGDFPTKEYSEHVVRENIQLLFDELKAYINTNLITAINDNMSRISNLGGGDDVQHDALADDAVWANNIKDGEITEEKYKDGSITPEKFNATEVGAYVKDLADGQIENNLGNVDNTSDANKPISTATQEALNTISNTVATKAPTASPALTGTPTAPTAATTVETDQVATTKYVHNYAPFRFVRSVRIPCHMNVSNSGGLGATFITPEQLGLTTITTKSVIVQGYDITTGATGDVTSYATRISSDGNLWVTVNSTYTGTIDIDIIVWVVEEG